MFYEKPANIKSICQRKKVMGIGVNDASYNISVRVDGKRYVCPFYAKWEGMICRCYSEKSLAKNKTYVGVTVCDEWLSFSNFKLWMQAQVWENFSLDKDIANYGSTQYSPENCSFIPQAVNSILSDCKSAMGEYPTGVSAARNGRFRAYITIKGRQKPLGVHDTVESAEMAYLKEKVKYLLAASFKVKQNKVADGLKKIARIFSIKVSKLEDRSC